VRVEHPRDVELVRHHVSMGSLGTHRIALHCAYHDGVGGASVVASRGSLPRSNCRVSKRHGADPRRFVVDAVGGRPRPRRARGHVDRTRSALWVRGTRSPRANARPERKHSRGDVCLGMMCQRRRHLYGSMTLSPDPYDAYVSSKGRWILGAGTSEKIFDLSLILLLNPAQLTTSIFGKMKSLCII